MTVSEVASVGSFVVALVILACVIFVSRQVMQTRKDEQASIRTARATRLVDINIAGTDPSVADAIMQGLVGDADMSPTQFAQFISFCLALFYNAEETFNQHKEGLLGDSAFESFAASVAGWGRSAGMRAAWKLSRPNFAREFAEWLDRTLREKAGLPLSDSFEDWKADIAEERAFTAQ